jgi:OmpA-OmpF porin, OOP family
MDVAPRLPSPRRNNLSIGMKIALHTITGAKTSESQFVICREIRSLTRIIMLTLNYKSVFCLSLAFTLSGCLATRKHVKSVSDPIDRRVGGLEAKSREVDGTLSTHEKGIAAADERAKGADQHAADAAKEAKTANERVGQLGEQTSAATAAVSKSASEARSVADRGLGKANDLEQRIGSLEDYSVAASQNILFGLARTNLTPDALKQLDEAAAEALKHKRYVIEVQGFADKTGSADVNLALSRQRADEVVRYLTSQHKIPLFRIFQLGSGSVMPVADDKTREGRKQNRRVEVKVYSADANGKQVTAAAK